MNPITPVVSLFVLFAVYIFIRMEKIMATIAELDASISALEASETTAAATITTALNDLIAKVGTTVDVTAEIGRIQAVATALGSLSDAAKGDDPGPTA